jgi:hypothetical protein
MIIRTELISEWLSALPSKVRNRIKTIFLYLQSQRSWRNIPYIKKLSDCGDVCEIIIKINNIQYRPLGCYGPGKDEFTLLVGASKKERIWTPRNARERAKKMAKLIRQHKDTKDGQHKN